MVEVSDTELAQLRRAHSLLDKLTGDAKHGLDAQRRLREIDPSLKFPALDIESTVSAPLREELDNTKATLAKIQEERAAERQAAADASLEAKLRSGLGRAKEKGKLSDEGVSNLVKFMQEKGVADAELALPAYLETLPKAPVAPRASQYSPMMADVFGTNVTNDSADNDAKMLATKPWDFFDREVGKVLNETDQAA